MAQWDIHTGGISSVVKGISSLVTDLDGDIKTCSRSLSAAVDDVHSPVVEKALADFTTSYGAEFKFIASRPVDAANALVRATNAYIKGDTDMASRAQARADSAEVPEMPKPAGTSNVQPGRP